RHGGSGADVELRRIGPVAKFAQESVSAVEATPVSLGLDPDHRAAILDARADLEAIAAEVILYIALEGNGPVAGSLTQPTPHEAFQTALDLVRRGPQCGLIRADEGDRW